MLPFTYYFNNIYLSGCVSSYYLFSYASFYFLISKSAVLLYVYVYLFNKLCNLFLLILNHIRLNILISKTIELILSLHSVTL